MHDVGVAKRRDHRLRRFALAAGVDGRPRLTDRLGLANRFGQLVPLPIEAEAIVLPEAIHYLQPLGGSRIPIVMLIELKPVLRRLVSPPGGNDVERKPPSGDVVDICRSFGEERGLVEVRSHRNHQLDAVRDSRQRRSRRPRVERWLVHALDVILSSARQPD